MNLEEYEIVLEELQQVIDDAKALLANFESHESEDKMEGDYEALQALYQRAVKSQQAYTLKMLDLLEREPEMQTALANRDIAES